MTVTAGTSSHGQGHETSYAQLVAGTLGVPLADVKVIQSDTKLVKRGMGTMGSRSLQVGGTAVQRATDEVLEKAKRLAAHLLEADAGDIEVVPGQGLGVAGSPALGDPVGASWRAPRPTRRARPRASRAAWRPRTTSRRRTRRTRSARTSRSSRSTPRPGWRTSSGTSRSTTRAASRTRCCVEGQVHGGIAQGVAQALFEEIAFDEDGNNVTGSLASYAIPSAGDLPNVRDRAHADADAAQPARARRASARRARSAPRRRSGTPSSTRSSHLGVRNIDMPATPQRVWRAISAAAIVSAAVSASMSSSRRAEPDARPDRSGQLGVAAGLQLGVQAARPRRRGRRSRRVSSGCAQKQPWRTPIAYSALSRCGERAVPCSPRG